MPFVEDFTPFLQESEFSTTAVVVSTGAQVQVIFDNGYAAALNGLAEASDPGMLGRTVDLSGLVHGSEISLPISPGSTTMESWSVVVIQPDGTGMTFVGLRKA